LSVDEIPQVRGINHVNTRLKQQMARDRTKLHGDLVALVPQVRRFAYALTRHADDADDLVQATMERVLARAMPDDVELVKWMFRVCRNIWIDDLRSRKVRREAVAEIAAENTLEASTEERVAAQAMLRKAQEGIDRLPEEQREVLAMVAIAGMAYREAAEALSIPIGTVMSRLARARAALAAHLEAPA
jgi:RNA polymerase sigma-70 factor (ECF subfamily)